MHKWIFLIALLTSVLANEINSQNSVIQLQESLKPQETEHNIKEDYINKRNQMINKDRSSHFTVDVKELTTEEKMVEQRLFGIRDAMLADNSPLLMEVHDAIDVMKTSKLFDVLKDMPKGAHLHFHIEGGISVDEFLEFTKEDYVYYSINDNLFKTAPNGFNATGYAIWILFMVDVKIFNAI